MRWLGHLNTTSHQQKNKGVESMSKDAEKYLQRMFKRRKCAECGREFESSNLESYAFKITIGAETKYFDCYNCMQKHKKRFKKFNKMLTTNDNFFKL